MTGPGEPDDETECDTQRSEPIVAPPTANPARVRVPPEGLGSHTRDPEPSGPPPQEPEEEA
ncbi:hypothetical protein [Micromonospora okii]|uniref:hypothetical protein n=1 Tax=Micromonospora okii TaxID=1182970 RepID=UPI001E519228|nr:hypothetical protein [Micromonospora okii]